MSDNFSSRSLMIQGTTSDAGKSVLCAGLCRVLSRRGYIVKPFKPQNMALNSAVTEDGGEIGRAQAVQAQACGVEPHTDMNPVLLKPNTDIGAQVIVQGHPLAEMDAWDYHEYKPRVLPAIVESYDRLMSSSDAVVIEGAGSPAEINLRDRDVANMGFAEEVECPVIIVADIDRGGVFAHLYGTLALLTPSEQKLVKGFVINRFRGDVNLLTSGLEWLERETGKPVLGVIPYLHGLHLEAEDAIVDQQLTDKTENTLKVVVPVLSRISNHTDFDPLRMNPNVDFTFVWKGDAFPACDLIILPGSKSTRADLDFLKENGWDQHLYRHLRFGGKVMGICGGYQMLGQMLHDPEGIEGEAGSSQGLGLLELETTIERKKQLHQVKGYLQVPGLETVQVTGYEIHGGITTGIALERPLINLGQRFDSVMSDDKQVLGTYLHGIFDHPDACKALLVWAGLSHVEIPDYNQKREEGINRVADAMEEHLDMDRITEILGI